MLTVKKPYGKVSILFIQTRKNLILNVIKNVLLFTITSLPIWFILLTQRRFKNSKICGQVKHEIANTDR